jgi:hypothetical protein
MRGGLHCQATGAWAHAQVFRAHLGHWWRVYFRIGNMPLVVNPGRAHQQRLFEAVVRALAHGYPTILWVANFPSLSINHSLLVYDFRTGRDKPIFQVYDPNDTEEPKELAYDIKRRTFSFQHTFYFGGGDVQARAIYRSPLQ